MAAVGDADSEKKRDLKPSVVFETLKASNVGLECLFLEIKEFRMGIEKTRNMLKDKLPPATVSDYPALNTIDSADQIAAEVLNTLMEQRVDLYKKMDQLEISVMDEDLRDDDNSWQIVSEITEVQNSITSKLIEFNNNKDVKKYRLMLETKRFV